MPKSVLCYELDKVRSLDLETSGCVGLGINIIMCREKERLPGWQEMT